MFVVAVLSAAAPAFARAGAQTQPQAVIEQTTYDFGDVFTGEELSHAFTVTNTGQSPLELSETPRVSRTRSEPTGPGGALQPLLRTVSFTRTRIAAPV